MTESIFHLTPNESWLAAIEKGAYHAESLSTEGFIHCSTKDQIVGVANTFYHGQQGLVLLFLNPDKLDHELKWELPAELEPTHAREGELFPHVYGPINLDAITDVIPFEPDGNGNFASPDALT